MNTKRLPGYLPGLETPSPRRLHPGMIDYSALYEDMRMDHREDLTEHLEMDEIEDMLSEKNSTARSANMVDDNPFLLRAPATYGGIADQSIEKKAIQEVSHADAPRPDLQAMGRMTSQVSPPRGSEADPVDVEDTVDERSLVFTTPRTSPRPPPIHNSGSSLPAQLHDVFYTPMSVCDSSVVSDHGSPVAHPDRVPSRLTALFAQIRTKHKVSPPTVTAASSADISGHLTSGPSSSPEYVAGDLKLALPSQDGHHISSGQGVLPMEPDSSIHASVHYMSNPCTNGEGPLGLSKDTEKLSERTGRVSFQVSEKVWTQLSVARSDPPMHDSTAREPHPPLSAGGTSVFSTDKNENVFSANLARAEALLEVKQQPLPAGVVSREETNPLINVRLLKQNPARILQRAPFKLVRRSDTGGRPQIDTSSMIWAQLSTEGVEFHTQSSARHQSSSPIHTDVAVPTNTNTATDNPTRDHASVMDNTLSHTRPVAPFLPGRQTPAVDTPPKQTCRPAIVPQNRLIGRKGQNTDKPRHADTTGSHARADTPSVVWAQLSSSDPGLAVQVDMKLDSSQSSRTDAVIATTTETTKKSKGTSLSGPDLNDKGSLEVQRQPSVGVSASGKTRLPDNISPHIQSATDATKNIPSNLKLIKRKGKGVEGSSSSTASKVFSESFEPFPRILTRGQSRKQLDVSTHLPQGSRVLATTSAARPHPSGGGDMNRYAEDSPSRIPPTPMNIGPGLVATTPQNADRTVGDHAIRQQVENDMHESEDLTSQVDKLMAELAASAQNEYATKNDVSLITLQMQILLRQNAQVLDKVNYHDSSTRNVGRQTSKSPRKAVRTEVKHRPFELTSLQAFIRLWTMHLLKRETDEDAINVPTKEELAQFKQRKHPGPTVSDFSLDLATDRILLGSPWNKKAIDVFVKSFVDSAMCPEVDSGSISKCFENHLKHLKNTYQIQTQGKSQDHRDKAKQKAREVRRRGLHTRRVDVVKSSHPLQRFATLVEGGGYMIESGDETEVEDGKKKHVRTTLAWRSPAFVDFLHKLDLLHLHQRYTDGGKKTRAGAFPHYRYTGSKRVEPRNTVVKGLPRNCYEDGWFIALYDSEKADLSYKDPIDFTLSAETLEIAARYSEVRTRSDKPKEPIKGP